MAKFATFLYSRQNSQSSDISRVLTHWILDIFSAAVSHGLSILGTKRKFGGHILKLRFLI